MTTKKKNIALLLGDPSGIGPELISKLLTQSELDSANIVVIGEKNILESGDKVTGNNSNLKFVGVSPDDNKCSINKNLFSAFTKNIKMKSKYLIVNK